MAFRIPVFAGFLHLVLGDEVLTLTSKNFDQHLRETTQTLVEFYAPWCGHCKKLAPEYEQAAQRLKGTGVKLAKVDATEEKDLASRFSVKGFPTLVWFEGGREMEYDGGRTENTIVDWVRSMTGEAIMETSAPPAPGADKPNVVLYHSAMLPAYEVVAKGNRRKASWYFVKGEKKAVVITHRGEDPVELTGALDEAKIADLMAENALPLFGQLGGETFDKYVETGKGLVWSMFPKDGMSMSELDAKYRPMMSDVAKKIRGKYLVAYTDTEQFKDAIDDMLGVSRFPAIAVQKKAGDKKRYVHTGGMTEGAISKFIADVDAGRVQPKLKSETHYASGKGPVKVVVGSTMERDLFVPNRDVMLEIYAPWCGHCRKLEPEYLKLAQKIESEGYSDLLTIAKLDGTVNDSPLDSIEWNGFPTIFYAKAGSRDVLTYDGERTAKGLWKYIKKHASQAEVIAERVAKRKKRDEM